MRNSDSRWQPGNLEKNLDAVQKLTELAVSKGATVSQLALAWILAHGEHIVPIPGTRSPQRVEENVGAVDVALTHDELLQVTQILPAGGYGARYADALMPTWH